MHDTNETAVAVTSPHAPTPAGPYSHGVIVGNLLFCAGQGPFGRQGERVGETFEDQVRSTFDNLQHICEAAGTSLSNTVRIGAYLSSMNLFDRFNAVYAERFSGGVLPARTTIPVDLRGFDVEIDVVVLVPGMGPEGWEGA